MPSHPTNTDNKRATLNFLPFLVNTTLAYSISAHTYKTAPF